MTQTKRKISAIDSVNDGGIYSDGQPFVNVLDATTGHDSYQKRAVDALLAADREAALACAVVELAATN